MKRPLSRTAAQWCENAMQPVCHCRCGGAYHGKNRGAVDDLPYGDPHSIEYDCPDCKGKGTYITMYGIKKTCRKCDGKGRLRIK